MLLFQILFFNVGDLLLTSSILVEFFLTYTFPNCLLVCGFILCEVPFAKSYFDALSSWDRTFYKFLCLCLGDLHIKSLKIFRLINSINLILISYLKYPLFRSCIRSEAFDSQPYKFMSWIDERELLHFWATGNGRLTRTARRRSIRRVINPP